MEDLEESLKLLDKTGEKKDAVKRKPEDKVGISSCTGEGMNYVLECFSCRKIGKRRIYVGERLRSGYQRGAEHGKEIEDGVLTHPMVLHFWDGHQGRKQEIFMRLTSSHLTPLDRQVTESVNILLAGKNQS